MKPLKVKTSLKYFTFTRINSRDFYREQNLTYIDLHNKHERNLHPELSELFMAVGLATGIRIVWRISLHPESNALLKSVRIIGPKAILLNLVPFFISFFYEYENYIAIWEKRHFYRLMVRRRTKGKTWANLPGRKAFISFKTRKFIGIYIKFFIKKLAIPKILTRYEIESYINSYIKKKDKRITYFNTLKKYGIYNNRFIV